MNTKLVIDQSTSATRRMECERAMHVIFAVLGVPRSYLDLDCRDGYMVRAARMFGCKPSVGQAFDPATKREARRYAQIFLGEVHGQYDLITCLNDVPSDVANHLNDDGRLVVVRAFPHGKGEVNGLRCDPHKTTDLQSLWSRSTEFLPPYVQVWQHE